MAGGPVAAVAMGVVSATFGGVVRDVLSGESPGILSREVYASAAIAGASTFVLLHEGGAGREIAVIAGFSAAAAIRFGALHWGWSLPRYGGRVANRTL